MLDGYRDAIFSKVRVCELFRPFGFKTGAAILQAGTPDACIDQPVAVQSNKPADEEKIQSGRGIQTANILLAGGSSIGTKDLMDGLSGAVFKSWYMIPTASVAIVLFSTGGDVNLKPGYKLEIEPLKR